NTEGEEAMTCRVTDIRAFADFAALYRAYNPVELGYAEGEEAKPSDMEQYYTNEQIAEYGALALTVAVQDVFA
ncbi:MAG: hypothetical protein J5755_05435, partial [Clostridia bacterium]|nr:hypothetical protein [Clostridia bacterium]